MDDAQKKETFKGEQSYKFSDVGGSSGEEYIYFGLFRK